MIEDIKMPMDGDYLSHTIFDTLNDIKRFYDSLSFDSFRFVTVHVKGALTNINSPIYSSIEATIESIELLLKKGHINDTIALIRKYDDAVITSIYLTLLQDDDKTKFTNSFDSGEVYDIYDNTVNEWVYAIKKDLKATRDKINNDIRTKDVNDILSKNPRIMKLRQFCNNNVHYNSLRYFLWNNPNYNRVGINRIKLLDMANEQLKCIFVFHFANIIVTNPEYLTSSYYIDTLDCGGIPEEGTQNWVALYAQECYNKYISSNMELAAYLKECNFLELQ